MLSQSEPVELSHQFRQLIAALSLQGLISDAPRPTLNPLS